MILDSPIISGSSTVTGDLTVLGTLIANVSGSSISASYATNAELLDGLDSTSFTTTSSFNTVSGSFSTRVTNLESFSSSLDATFATDAQLTAVSQSFSSSLSTVSESLSSRVANNEATGSSLTTASGSFSTRVTNTEATASSLTTASSSFSTRVTNNESNISSLQTASGSFSTRTTNLETASGSFSTRTTNLETASGSFSTRVTSVEGSISSLNSKSGSYATTGSNNFNGNQVITGSLTTTGTITAQTLNVQQVTSSIVYSSGSNIFGNSVSNTQQFTGSVLITGSLAVNAGTTTVGILTGSSALFSSQVDGTIFNSTSNAFRFSGNNAISLVSLNSQNVVKINAAGYWGTQLVGANDQGILINNTGLVGLGTTTPGSRLHIVDSSGPVIRLVRTSNRFDVEADNNAMGAVSRDSSTAPFYFSGFSGVGIGTTSPAADLQVGKSSDVVVAMSNSSSVTSGNRGSIAWYNSSVSTVAVIRAAAVTDNVGTELQFFTRPAAGNLAQVMTLTSTGNLGIGTTLPPTKFAVKDGTDTVIQYYASGADGYLGMGNEAGSIGGASKSFNLLTGTQFTFATGGSERMRISSGGSVGIGTTSFLNTANFQMSAGSGASATPYMAIFNTATSPTVNASTRFDLGFLNGSSDYVATNTILGSINFMGQANDAGYGGAGIYAQVVSGGNVGRGSGHGVDLIFNTKATDTLGYNERMRITSGGLINMGTTSAYTSRLNVQSTSPSVAAIKAGYGGVSGNGYTVLADNYTLNESLMSIGIDYSSGGLVLGSTMAPSTTIQGGFISTQAQFGGFGSAIRLSTSGEILFYRGTQDSVISTGNAKAATVSLFINNAGNIGIGTTNTDPLSLARDRNLAIVTTGTNAALTIVGGGASRIDFGVGSTRTAGIYSDTTNYTEIFTSTSLPLVFSTNSVERMRITNAGAYEYRATDGAINFTAIDTSGGTSSDYGSFIFNLKRGVDSDQYPNVLVLKLGNVGIGTSSPTYNLQVVNSASGVAVAAFQNTLTSGYSGAHFLNNSGTLIGHWGYGNASVGGPLADLVYFGSIASKAVVFTTNDTEKMRITSAGSVGIGTTSPGASLHVVGNEYIAKSGGEGTYKQTVVGQTTAAASGVAKKIAYVGFTHSIRVYIWANQSAAHGSSAIADICTVYGASSGGTVVESNFGNVTDITVAYNNGGSPAYTIDVTLTYSGTAPTINYVIEGVNHDNNIYTIA